MTSTQFAHPRTEQKTNQLVVVFRTTSYIVLTCVLHATHNREEDRRGAETIFVKIDIFFWGGEVNEDEKSGREKILSPKKTPPLFFWRRMRENAAGIINLMVLGEG